MNRTYDRLHRLTYVILLLLALSGLLDAISSLLTLETMPIVARAFCVLSVPVLLGAIIWAGWAVAAKRPRHRVEARAVVLTITVVFLWDLALSLTRPTAVLTAGHYQAYFWKFLLLSLVYPLVFSYKRGLAGIAVVLFFAAVIPFRYIFESTPKDRLLLTTVEFLASYLSFVTGIVLVILIGHTKHAYLQVDREIESMRRLAQTDPLTDAWNRRRLNDAFAEAIAEGQVPLTVIMFDIDSFKEINDMYGHQVGDQALITTTHLAQGVLRSQDVISRWGGEEFLVLCPATTLEQGIQIAERIREAISSHAFDEVGTITASFGVAEYRPGETVEELVARADQALYVAKERGKNCVEAAGFRTQFSSA